MRASECVCVCVCERERDRERDRERHRERQRQRQTETEKQRERESDREKERVTDGERGGGWEKIDLKTTKTKYYFVIIQVLWTLLEIMMTVCPCCNKNRTNKHFFYAQSPKPL